MNVDIVIVNGTCDDLTVTWKVDWNSEYGMFKNLPIPFSTAEKETI